MSWTLHLQRVLGTFSLNVSCSAPTMRLAVIGQNGSGKSSLLRSLLLEAPPRHWEADVEGLSLLQRRDGESIPCHKRGIAYLPQGVSLFSHLNALDNVALGSALSVGWTESRRRAAELLASHGLTGAKSLKPLALSAGQRQALGLLRTLNHDARCLVLDEPMSAIDRLLSAHLFDGLRRALDASQLPVLFSSHDPALVKQLADWVVVLEEGQVSQSGPVNAVATNPSSLFVERFFGDL